MLEWLLVIYAATNPHQVYATQAPRGEIGYISEEVCSRFGQALQQKMEGLTYECLPVTLKHRTMN